MSTVTLGLARARELAQLPAIEAAAATLFPPGRLPEPNLMMTDTQFLAASNAGQLLVARVNEQPVGYALCSTQGTALHLEEVSVHPDFGRRGIGRQLVLAVLDLAAAGALGTVTLTTFSDLRWNAPFYKSLGFAVIAHPNSPPGSAPAHVLDHLRQEAALGFTHRVGMQAPAPARPGQPG
jgi:GNAT superfamily N-acetyltransferase